MSDVNKECDLMASSKGSEAQDDAFDLEAGQEKERKGD